MDELNLENLSTLKKTKWNEKFNDIDLSAFEEIEQEFYKLFPVFSVNNQIFNADQLKDMLFYRVRPYSEIRDYSNVKEYSYPPPKFVSNQRANIKNHPVFYCSAHPNTCLLEFIKNNRKTVYRDKYALSVWKLNTKSEYNVAKFLNEEFSEKEIKSLSLDYEKSFRKHISENFDHKDRGVLIELSKYFSASFLRKNNYAFSSFIAHKYLYKSNTDMIVFPSIVEKYSSLNFAFNRFFADENLQLQRVYKIKIGGHSHKLDNMTLTFLDQALSFKDNKLHSIHNIIDGVLLKTMLWLDFNDNIDY